MLERRDFHSLKEAAAYWERIQGSARLIFLAGPSQSNLSAIRSAIRAGTHLPLSPQSKPLQCHPVDSSIFSPRRFGKIGEPYQPRVLARPLKGQVQSSQITIDADRLLRERGVEPVQ